VCGAGLEDVHVPHIMLGGKDSLGDDQIALAQHVAKTLVERIGEAYPGNGYNPAHIALIVFYRGVLQGHCKTQGELN
jgi:hypothetical protein